MARYGSSYANLIADAIDGDQQQSANSYAQQVAGALPPLPQQSEVRSGWDTSDWVNNIVMGAGAFVPGLSTATSAINAGIGAYEGYNDAVYGPSQTQYAIGDGSTSQNVDNSPSFWDQLMNPSATIGRALGNVAGNAFGGGSVIDYQPPQTQSPPQPMNDAQRSLQQAYSSGQRYDTTGRGWVADPSKDYVPQAPTAEELAARNVALNIDQSSGSSGGGGYTPWYAGGPDPFSATGNINNRVSAYDFGAGRYEGSPALSASWGGSYGGDSLDTPIFGPGARFVHGDKFNTD